MAPAEKYQPLLMCFAGPIASGKSTICRKLAADDPSLELSISTTTRGPRTGEQEGIHYYFVDQAEFTRRVAAGLFFEHAQIGDQAYGTELKNIEAARSGHKDLLLDIDVQGVRLLKQKFPNQTVVICVFPPSAEVLRKRLEARGTDSPERIASRMQLAERELEVLRDRSFTDYLLINEDLESTVLKAHSIIRAERLRLKHFSDQQLGELLRVK